MERKKLKLSILTIFLLIIFLSGCGDDNTANKVVESLEEKDYFTAGQIYDEAVQDLSEEEKENVDGAVSKAIIEFLENRHKEMESDSSLEASFYNSLDKIEEIAINDETLNKRLKLIKQREKGEQRKKKKDSNLAESNSELDSDSSESTYIKTDSESNTNSSDSPYTKEELEDDPSAPSTNPSDYNEDGEYVPADGPTDNPADYNSNGEYKPVEDMTQEEIQAELEAMFGN